MKKMNLIYVLGMGMLCGYYGLTCVMFILAFVLGKPTVILHLNPFGELTVEFVLTVLSIPCAIYTVKESIKLRKRATVG